MITIGICWCRFMCGIILFFFGPHVLAKREPGARKVCYRVIEAFNSVLEPPKRILKGLVPSV